MKPPRFAALLALLCLASLQEHPRAQAPARHVDRTQLMWNLADLAAPGMEGRATGTRGGLQARQWLVEQFRAIGLAPVNRAGYEQAFTVGRSSTLAANVVGRVAGRDPRLRAFVITAHYDHLGIRDGILYPGADDNASGVAVLLASARYFAAHAPRRPMLFAALDAEELGLHGARTLVGSSLVSRGRVALNVNVDMVSRGSHEIYAAGTYHSPWQIPILQEVQRHTSVRIRFGHDRPESAAGGPQDWTRLSDHAAFHATGIPFLYFGVEEHPDHHGPGDTVDRIDTRFFGDVADMIVETIRTFDQTLP